MSSGIRLLHSEADRAAFASVIASRPFYRALFGRDLRLWTDNPGAPTKLYWLPQAALAISGRSAQLCGAVEDWEELTLFLRFAGVERITADRPASLPLCQMLHLFSLEAGESLPLGNPPAGLILDKTPPVSEVAELAFPEVENNARRDAFYSETCTAVAHGLARVWALRAVDGTLVSMVGAYAMANGEAYLATGETVPELRGQGIGGWLIPALANDLSAEGWQITLLCEENRRHFYTRLGFQRLGAYGQYLVAEQQDQKEET